eukprot:TRINITY_DN2198_c0_g1_i13.p1 TRINITY_DN2198_c0_g1~~TRINITY_DN2198_c0_g1_i13.p1  ORF type:complete len:244 (-),score=12.12 TRINITY_DN2198_c0_g1_i13:357-1088(-)
MTTNLVKFCVFSHDTTTPIFDHTLPTQFKEMGEDDIAHLSSQMRKALDRPNTSIKLVYENHDCFLEADDCAWLFLVYTKKHLTENMARSFLKEIRGDLQRIEGYTTMTTETLSAGLKEKTVKLLMKYNSMVCKTRFDAFFNHNNDNNNSNHLKSNQASPTKKSAENSCTLNAGSDATSLNVDNISLAIHEDSSKKHSSDMSMDVSLEFIALVHQKDPNRRRITPRNLKRLVKPTQILAACPCL